MSSEHDLQQTAAGLRRDFDRAFAHAPPAAEVGQVDLLLIGVAERHYAVRLADVIAVQPIRPVVAVPSPDPKLCGLAGLRGNVTPVFDLALTLGHPRAAKPRWLIELRSPEACALAFAELYEHLRLGEAELMPAVTPTATHRLASGTVLTSAGPTPLIDLVAVYAELTGQKSFPPRRESEGRT